MGKIYLKFDNALKQEDIIMPLVDTSSAESDGHGSTNISGYQQTSFYGVFSPLIQINNIVVAFRDIIPSHVRVRKKRFALSRLQPHLFAKELMLKFTVPRSQTTISPLYAVLLSL